MDDPRFASLRRLMHRSGIASSHAKRAAHALEARFGQFVDEGLARGESPARARAEAHRRLGDDAVLIRDVSHQPKSIAWVCRWPGLMFSLVPVALFGALVVLTTVALAIGNEWLGRLLPQLHVTARAADLIGFAVSGWVMWCVPLNVSALLAFLAWRHRVPLRWPLMSTTLMCLLAGLCNFSFVLDPDTPGLSGSVGLGFGWGLDTLLTQALRSLVIALMVFLPLLWATRSAGSRP